VETLWKLTGMSVDILLTHRIGCSRTRNAADADLMKRASPITLAISTLLLHAQ